ncbi:hypothetical protein H7X69_00465 [Candidatus Saccharibacteria bacterium]|nr:hypothetical protein [Candidatus Saccharibacteria bacterium]
MQKLLSKNYALVGFTAIAVMAAVTFAVSTQPVSARDDQTTTEVKKEQTQQTMTAEKREALRIKEAEVTEQRRLETEVKIESETRQTTATDKREAARTKLADVKLKVCQKREKKIDNIMARMSDRGVKHLAVFTKIAERTEAFYVKSGKVLSNYDVLVAEVAAKKADAQAAIAATQSTTVTFKCDGTDPKGAVGSFKTNLTAQHEALKAYRTAVKNLIVGVKSVQGTTRSDDAKTNEGSN